MNKKTLKFWKIVSGVLLIGFTVMYAITIFSAVSTSMAYGLGFGAIAQKLFIPTVNWGLGVLVTGTSYSNPESMVPIGLALKE